MIKSILAAGVTLAIVACNNSVSKQTPQVGDMNNSISKAEKKDGWELLFDGVSTKGWHAYHNKPVGSAWKVMDGTLFLDVTEKKDGKVVGGGDIVTDEDFGNFHLKYDWKVAPKGNGGVIFYAQEDDKYKYPWETGPE